MYTVMPLPCTMLSDLLKDYPVRLLHSAFLTLVLALLSACSTLEAWWSPPPPLQIVYLRATGYAAVLTDPALSSAQLTIMAQRASRMDAYRRLAEIVNGIRLSRQGEVQSFVYGTLRGARQVSSRPIRDGSMWETVLELKYDPAAPLSSDTDGAKPSPSEEADDAIDPYFYLSR